VKEFLYDTSTIPACDRRTDGRTELLYQYCALYSWMNADAQYKFSGHLRKVDELDHFHVSITTTFIQVVVYISIRRCSHKSQQCWSGCKPYDTIR